MVTSPALTPVTMPDWSTVATAGFDDDQETLSHGSDLVMLSSLNDAKIAKSESNAAPSRERNRWQSWNSGMSVIGPGPGIPPGGNCA
jgi:hypothetical protein